MRGAANGDGLATGGDDVRDRVGLGQHERQRAGPECPGQLSGGPWPGGDAALGHLDGIDVYDERVAGGSALGLEDAGDGSGRAGIGSQAVNGLGRQSDELPLAQ